MRVQPQQSPKDDLQVTMPQFHKTNKVWQLQSLQVLWGVAAKYVASYACLYLQIPANTCSSVLNGLINVQTGVTFLALAMRVPVVA